MLSCAGINASDINYTAGRYFGSPEVAAKRLPFDAGFESVGAVAATGPDVSGKLSTTLSVLTGSPLCWQVQCLFKACGCACMVFLQALCALIRSPSIERLQV